MNAAILDSGCFDPHSYLGHSLDLNDFIYLISSVMVFSATYLSAVVNRRCFSTGDVTIVGFHALQQVGMPALRGMRG